MERPESYRIEMTCNGKSLTLEIPMKLLAEKDGRKTVTDSAWVAVRNLLRRVTENV